MGFTQEFYEHGKARREDFECIDNIHHHLPDEGRIASMPKIINILLKAVGKKKPNLSKLFNKGALRRFVEEVRFAQSPRHRLRADGSTSDLQSRVQDVQFDVCGC